MWVFQNWSVLYGPDADPIQTLTDIVRAVRWAVLGMALFGVSWLWALASNAAILRSARQASAGEKPPVLHQ
jgi:hypothetical protein